MLSDIEASNFQSWKHLKFSITKGVTLIDGWNEDDQTPEGSGKSAIINALSWNIFGKLPKEALVDEVIKRGEATCMVISKFSNGDRIVRSRKPNDLFIKKADGKIIKGKDAKETQQLIEDYVGCNFETFCQSTYFAQNYDKKFLSSNQEDRGKILSSIQNLSVFDKARKEVMDLLKIENEKVTTMTQKLETEKNNIHHIQSKIKMLDDFIVNKTDFYERTKKDLAQKIDSSRNLLASQETQKVGLQQRWEQLSQELNGQLGNDDKLFADINAIKVEIGSIMSRKAEIGNHNKTVTQMDMEGRRNGDRYNKLVEKKLKLEQFIQNPSSNCPTCGSVLSGVDISHSLQELEELNSEMNDIIARVTEIGKYLDTNKIETAASLDVIERGLRTRIFEIESVQTKIKSKQKEIDSLKYSNMSIDTNIESTKSNIARQELELEQLPIPDISKELNDKEKLTSELIKTAEAYGEREQLLQQTKDYVSRLDQLKDGFREIKSYVFNNALSELNYRTNQYLNDLFEVDASIKFTTEDQKIATRAVYDGNETGLGLLSGGQHRRFNLAVDLALADIVASRKSSKLNLLVMDEYFKDLSEVSMEKCLTLLRSRKSPILIIEHNSIFKSIVDNTFFARLEDGTSHESRQ